MYGFSYSTSSPLLLIYPQRLMGASLLVFKNKSDVSGCMSEDDIREVRVELPITEIVQIHLPKHYRVYNWIASKPTSGIFCLVLL